MKTMTLLFAALAVFAILAMPSAREFLTGAAEKAFLGLTGHMQRSGLMLGMAEFSATQIAGLAASPKTKVQPFDNGSPQVLIASTPAVAAWAQNDTFVIGVIPKGARILRSGKMWHGAFGASVTMTIGLRDAVTKSVINAAGLLASASVATAGLVKNIDTGALLNQTGGYITTADVEVYATLAAADPTNDIQAEFEISYLGNSPT